MMRLLLVALFGLATYKFARAFVRSVPGDFEPIGLLPAPETENPSLRPKAASSTARRSRARK